MTPSIPADEPALRAYLDELDTLVEPADERVRWALYCHYKKEPGPDLAQAEAERAAFLLDERLRAVIEVWGDRPGDPLLRRRLQLWRKLTLAAALRDVPEIRDLRTELNRAIVAYRPQIDGEHVSRTDVAEALRTDHDSGRRHQAWQAFGGLSRQVEDRVREIIRRRNARATALGYPDYVDLSLELDGLSRREVEALFDDVDRVTRPIYERLLREGAARRGLARVEPWDVTFATDRADLVPDVRFPRGQMEPWLEVLRHRIGVPDGRPIRFEFLEVPFGGLTNYVKIPTDMRILMGAADGHAYYVTLFHEYGHGLHNNSITERSFILQKESGPYAESMAQVMAYFANHPGWLEEAPGLPPEEMAGLRRARLAEWVVRTRQLLAAASFERHAYADPDSDLDALLSQTEKHYLLVDAPVEARWAASPFYSIYPIYLHNYVVADVVASEVHAALRRDLGDPYGNRATFRWLVDRLYAPAASLPWRRVLQDATGADLDPSFLAADINSLAG